MRSRDALFAERNSLGAAIVKNIVRDAGKKALAFTQGSMSRRTWMPFEINRRNRTLEHREKAAARHRERYKKEPRLVVHNRMASAIYQAIRGGKAGRKWETVVGYTLNELVRHLERQFLPGMSWKNMGKWHIDHIVPKASFAYETADDEGFRAAWAISNLRPLWAGKNQEKHAKRTHLL